jgi:hypothetical protein
MASLRSCSCLDRTITVQHNPVKPESGVDLHDARLWLLKGEVHVNTTRNHYFSQNISAWLAFARRLTIIHVF